MIWFLLCFVALVAAEVLYDIFARRDRLKKRPFKWR